MILSYVLLQIVRTAKGTLAKLTLEQGVLFVMQDGLQMTVEV